MAEVITILGGASSIEQLVDCVAKLKGVCGAYKYASTDLADLVIETSIGAKHLNESRGYFEKTSLLDCDLVTECLEYLEQALLAINVVSSEMQKSFSSHKRIGAMKFVWKSDQIQKLRRKPGRAQRLLDQQKDFWTALNAKRLRNSEQSRQLQAMRFNNDLFAQVLQQSRGPMAPDLFVKQTHTALSVPLTAQNTYEALKKTSLVGPRHSSKARKYKFTLPQWLWSKVFEAVIWGHMSSVNYGLRWYNIVSENSDIFKAIGDDDVDSIKHLFSTGQATPFDIWKNGRSMVEWAACCCHPRPSRFLISQGAEFDPNDSDGLSFWFLFGWMLTRHRPWYNADSLQLYWQNVSETFDVLTNVLDDEGVTKEEHVFDQLIGLRDVRLLIQTTSSRARFLPREKRAHLLIQCPSPTMIENLLGPDLSLTQAFALVSIEEPLHRHLLMFILAANKHELHRWSPICRELIAFDQSLGLDYYQQSPVLWSWSIIFAFVHVWKFKRNALSDLCLDLSIKYNSYLQERLSYLESLGADLHLLGQIDRLLLYPAGSSSRNFGTPEYPWKVIGLETGPSPSDWKVWIAPNGWEYEWAGKFWHRIENPELYIPGSFVDDEEEEEKKWFRPVS